MGWTAGLQPSGVNGVETDLYRSLWLERLQCIRVLSVLTNTAPIRNEVHKASDSQAAVDLSIDGPSLALSHSNRHSCFLE